VRVFFTTVVALIFAGAVHANARMKCDEVDVLRPESGYLTLAEILPRGLMELTEVSNARVCYTPVGPLFSRDVWYCNGITEGSISSLQVWLSRVGYEELNRNQSRAENYRQWLDDTQGKAMLRLIDTELYEEASLVVLDKPTRNVCVRHLVVTNS